MKTEIKAVLRPTGTYSEENRENINILLSHLDKEASKKRVVGYVDDGVISGFKKASAKLSFKYEFDENGKLAILSFSSNSPISPLEVYKLICAFKEVNGRILEESKTDIIAINTPDGEQFVNFLFHPSE